MTLYVFAVVGGVTLAGVLLLWDMARRRAKAVQRAEALEPYAALGEGIEGVAHDARNLLFPVRCVLEDLSGDDELRKLAGEDLRTATLSLDQAQAFLSVLVDDPDRAQGFDAVACMRLAIALQRTRKIGKNELSGKIVVHGQPRALSRVCTNLLANALEHAGKAEVGSDDAAIWVSNPLTGDAPDDRIYDKGHSTRAAGGGLGLYWSKVLCEQLGATLSHETVRSPHGGRLIRFTIGFANRPVEDPIRCPRSSSL